MKKIRKMILMMCAAVMLSGCSSSQGTEEDVTIAGRLYLLYRVENNEFYTADYYSEITDAAALVEELIHELGLDSGSICVTNSNVANGVAYIYFNGNYTAMDTVYEVLFRASVVKTMAQADAVNYVYFYVENKPLTYLNGQIVGLMAAEDFIADSDRDLNSLSWTTLTLYFADADGQKLVENKIDAAYSRTMPLENIVMEQIIQGPEGEEGYAVFPQDVKVLGTSVRDDICYVNFDVSFAEIKTEIPFDVAMYAVINSLCELTGINRVQFQLNSDSHVEVNGFSFDSIYRRNLDYLE